MYQIAQNQTLPRQYGIYTRVWNALPADVTSAPYLFTFRKRLKLHLFPLSYPGLVH